MNTTKPISSPRWTFRCLRPQHTDVFDEHVLLEDFNAMKDRAEEAERKLKEAQTDRDRCLKNWLAFQDLTGEQCMELALPIVEGWRDAAREKEQK